MGRCGNNTCFATNAVTNNNTKIESRVRTARASTSHPLHGGFSSGGGGKGREMFGSGPALGGASNTGYCGVDNGLSRVRGKRRTHSEFTRKMRGMQRTRGRSQACSHQRRRQTNIAISGVIPVGKSGSRIEV